MMNVKSFTAARQTHAGVTSYSAALLTLGGAAIHLAVAPPHFREYVPFGVFFFAVGLAQAIGAVELAVRPTRRLLLLMAGGSAALVGLWLVSRTAGLPIGPEAGHPEELGLPDLICNVMEVVATLLLLILSARHPRQPARRRWVAVVGAVPAALLAAGLTATALAAGASPMPEAFNAAPPAAGSAAVSVASLTERSGDEPVDRFTLTARVGQIDGQPVWAYNGTVPGPELHVTQGHRVQVTLVNELPEVTTVHWHGLRLPNAEDGVAGLTQDAVQPGHSYTYEFVARDAGTYWYHSHQQTGEQIPRGLFGALIVEPARPTEDRDYTVLLHGRPGHVRVDKTRLEAEPGETVRLRVIDAVVPGMEGGPENPVLVGAPARVAALDGHELNEPQPLGPTRVPLGMGQRADFVFTMPAANSVRLELAQREVRLSPVERVFAWLRPNDAPPPGSVTIGSGPTPELPDVGSAPLFDLATYGAPLPRTGGPFDGVATLVLGKNPAIRDGRIELVHTINGEASPDVPALHVSEGERVLVHIVNETDEYHPIHLHGHAFEVLSRNGEPLSGSPVRLDSVMVGPGETWDAAFTADNPGIWMIHCHVLIHAGSGMAMTVNYDGVYTPFEMGTASGNVPE
jgi:FtsP/CotA-like multicopper oxidase with cupredoxin domain